MRLRLPGNRTLLWIVVVLVAAWLVMRHSMVNGAALPWNKGQAGTIFQGGHMGGGQ